MKTGWEACLPMAAFAHLRGQSAPSPLLFQARVFQFVTTPFSRTMLKEVVAQDSLLMDDRKKDNRLHVDS